jgi:hypothetical protein
MQILKSPYCDKESMPLIMVGNFFTISPISKKCQNCNRPISLNIFGYIFYLATTFSLLFLGYYLGIYFLDILHGFIHKIPKRILGIIIFLPFGLLIVVTANYVIAPFILYVLRIKLIKK